MRKMAAVVILLGLLGAVPMSAQEVPWETLYVTGASHIDLAWKWSYARAQYISLYTFGSALDMMDDYDAPEYGENPVYYAQSNAHAYRWIETKDPEMFGRIGRRVADGHWEIVGGMWVESDALLPSGESFCRQFLHGQWYFQERFGRMATIGWLPDSFGYNANLPQFMRKSGIDKFFFYKLNWNDTYAPDYNVFTWRAPDGSEVLAHLAYAEYNNRASTKKIAEAVAAKRAHEPDQTAVFFPLGVGNHGGGIVRNNMIRMRRFAEAGYTVRFGRVDDYFATIDPASVDRVIEDELYFERHRGTYTSRARHKKNVRELEYRLQNAEVFASLDWLMGGSYPDEFLEEAWTRLLRDQFHDTMAGTCLDRVYTTEVAENLDRVRTIADQTLDGALGDIAARIDTSAFAGAEVLVVFNPSGFEVTQPVEIAATPYAQRVVDENGDVIPSQYSERAGTLTFIAESVPPWGWKVYAVAAGDAEREGAFAADARHLENEHLAVVLDEAGYIVSVLNKDLGREFVEPGRRANELQLYTNDRSQFDSWDLGFDKYADVPETIVDALSVELVEDGPVRQVIEVRRRGVAESYVQRILLYAGSDSLDFETHVLNWGDPMHRFLKVAFPTGLTNEWRVVRHNIPYGYLDRVLDGHRADWEFAGQKWVDLTETRLDGTPPTAGLTLYSMEKYGYDVANDGPGEGLSDGRANVLRLSLLKSGTSPLNTVPQRGGPVTDRGDFSAHYRIYPHMPDVSAAEIYRRGEAYANPLLVAPTDAHAGALPRTGTLFSIASAGGAAVPTTLKRPHNAGEERELVLRLVEIGGEDAVASLESSAWELLSAHRSDLLERSEETELADGASGFEMPVGHRAVETVRLIFGDWKTGEPDEDEDDDEDDDDDGGCG